MEKFNEIESTYKNIIDSIKENQSFNKLDIQLLAKEISLSKGIIYVLAEGNCRCLGDRFSLNISKCGFRSFNISSEEINYGKLKSISKNDVAIFISKSGENDSMISISPYLKRYGVKICTITSQPRSSLGRISDLLIQIQVKEDNLLDTLFFIHTTILLDAVTSLLSKGKENVFFEELKRKKEKNYTVGDLISIRGKNPIVNSDNIFKEALIELTSKGLGAVSVVDKEGKLVGIITDGDVRRLVQKSQGSFTRLFLCEVKDIMTKNPKFITSEKTVSEAIRIMEGNSITVLPVLDQKNKPIGMVHLHDLVKLELI